MLLSNISNVLHNFTFSSVKVFEATAQRSLGWQGREILSMIPPPLFWGTFLQIWMQHSNKVGLHLTQMSFVLTWAGTRPRRGRNAIDWNAMYAIMHPTTCLWPGSCYFEIIAHLGQKNAHTWPKPFILDRTSLMRNWAKAKITVALQLMAIREFLNASYNQQ